MRDCMMNPSIHIQLDRNCTVDWWEYLHYQYESCLLHMHQDYNDKQLHIWPLQIEHLHIEVMIQNRAKLDLVQLALLPAFQPISNVVQCIQLFKRPYYDQSNLVFQCWRI